uniref:hypothetical protein n=1 Tax=Saccharothrix mutabilis TaxID=33921 RepID=UPI0031D969A2
MVDGHLHAVGTGVVGTGVVGTGVADGVTSGWSAGAGGVAYADRPRCGRPTRTGEPCLAPVRYSVPLGRFAPACPRHLDPRERRRLDDEPLWSARGQVHWALVEASAAGSPVAAFRIAARLQIQLPVVVEALHRLATEGRVGSVTAPRGRVWGTPEVVERWAAERDLAPASTRDG